jgi:superfamily II DNA or RNA helicase
MINLDIKWSDPVQVEKNGDVTFQREWVIDPIYLNQFFAYWKVNKLTLKSKGYGVVKREQYWVLTQTNDNPTLFKDPKKPKQKVDETLPLYEVKTPDGLRPWQVGAVSKIVSSIKKWGAAVDGSDVGCHAKGQTILMFDGTIKLVENIVVNDVIMGWNGPQKVTSLCSGNEQMVKIIPTKGDSFTVNINHILTVKITKLHSTKKSIGGYNSNEIYDIKVADYLKLPLSVKRHMKLFRVAVDNWATKNHPFSPYFMGLLLGDGGLSQKSIITFTSIDDICWQSIIDESHKNNWLLGNTNETITKRITNAPTLFKYLRDVGLLPIKCEDRFIPTEYKICNKNQRLEILAGLLDSDGYYRNGGFDFTSKSYQLANDVAFISRSLGFAAYIKCVKKKCTNNDVVGDYYNVSISGNCESIPTRIQRKKSNIRNQKKDVLVVGFTVESMSNDDFYGFSLDGDGRFLLGDFTVTHNTGKTYTATAVARELDMDIMIVCPKAVKESWKRVIKNHFKLWGKCVGIINYEALRTGKSDNMFASYVKRRDTHRKEFVWKVPKNTLIVWDEAQKLKNAKTKNSEMCMAALKQGYKMLFCSATMATNPLELRTVGQCIQLFKNNKQYYEWAYAHGVTRGRFGLEFRGNVDALKKLSNDIFVNRGVRLNRDSIPNFPESQIIAECYEMDKEDQDKINSAYEEMQLELLKIEKLLKKDKKSTELTAILRSRQKIEMIKVPLFVEMVEEALENNMSVVVFCNFSETIEALSQRLNTKCIVNGEAKYAKTRQQSIDDFQADKQRVILINLAAGGAGLSLHDVTGKYPRLALISPSYSAVNMRQATGRVWRDSAKSKSIQKIVFVSGTVEEKVCNSVNQKLANLDLLNDGDMNYVK